MSKLMKLNIQYFAENDEVFGFCEKGCKHPIYSKEKVDNLLESKIDSSEVESKIDAKLEAKPNVYSGTEEPTAEIGVNGDIYLKYE